MKDIEDLSNEDLKQEIGIVIRELQKRDIKFCSICGATDFFSDGCDVCKKTSKEIAIEMGKAIISKVFKERTKLRDFLKEYDKTKEKEISFKDLKKEIKMTEKTLKEHLNQMLMDGEIYEAKPKCYRWLG